MFKLYYSVYFSPPEFCNSSLTKVISLDEVLSGNEEHIARVSEQTCFSHYRTNSNKGLSVKFFLTGGGAAVVFCCSEEA